MLSSRPDSFLPFLMLIKMIKMHGLKNGTRRFVEEIKENRLFDILNGVDTAKIVIGEEFFASVSQDPSQGANWYQPTYATPLIKAFRYLRDRVAPHKPILFVDLGVGKGKPCIIAAKIFSHCHVVGVDLSQQLLDICRKNLQKCAADFELLCKDVRDVDYAGLFSAYETVVIHNKNSFDKAITAEVLKKIEAAKGNRDLFYVYNNPVYRDIFQGKERMFTLDGWHKNRRLDIYRV